MRVNYPIDVLQEAEHLSILLKETDHRLITACQLLIGFVPARIVDGTAVEHIASTVSRQIDGESLLI